MRGEWLFRAFFMAVFELAVFSLL